MSLISIAGLLVALILTIALAVLVSLRRTTLPPGADPMTFYVDRNSWHWRIASGTFYKPTDMCEYTRRVIGHSLLMMCLVIACLSIVAGMGFVLYMIGSALYDVYMGAEWTEKTKTGLFLGATLVVVGTGCAVGWWWSNRRDDNDVEPSQPSFVATAYRSWKDKNCKRVAVLPHE